MSDQMNFIVNVKHLPLQNAKNVQMVSEILIFPVLTWNFYEEDQDLDKRQVHTF